MKYIVLPQCIDNIKRYYLNVAKKYAHTYSLELMHKNVDEAIDAIYKIENGLIRRKPILKRWEGCYMAKAQNWYYAYKIFEDTIVVIDACHSNNMTERLSS